MVSHRFLLLTLTCLATVGAAVVAASIYTLPNHGTEPYGLVAQLITAALHDPRDTVAVVSPDIGIVRAEPSGTRADSLGPCVGREPCVNVAAGSVERLSEASLAWARAVATRDSAALRAWLGPTVLATAAVHGDSVQLTLRRLTLHPGCPLLSTLHATFEGQSQMGLHLLRLEASCPA